MSDIIMWSRVLTASEVRGIASCPAQYPTGELLKMRGNSVKIDGSVTTSDFHCSKWNIVRENIHIGLGLYTRFFTYPTNKKHVISRGKSFVG